MRRFREVREIREVKDEKTYPVTSCLPDDSGNRAMSEIEALPDEIGYDRLTPQWILELPNEIGYEDTMRALSELDSLPDEIS